MTIIGDFFKKSIKPNKKGGAKEEELDAIEVVKKIEKLYNSAYKSILQFHRDWYIHDRFLRGEHWIVFNKSLNTIQTLPVVEGEIRRTVNKIRSQTRGIKNFILRIDPTWEVIPQGTSDEAQEHAKNGGIIARYYFHRLKIRQRISDCITYGLKYSFGIFEMGIEDVEGDGVEDVTLRTPDPFDFVFDPETTQVDLSDCRYYIKSVRKAVSAVKENPAYNNDKNPYKKNLENLKEQQGTYASAEYKDSLLRRKYGGEAASDEDLKTIIIDETWLKYKEGKKTKIKVITTAGRGDEGQLLRIEETEYEDFPIIIYAPEIEPGHLYSTPWIKDLISLNKSLDKTVSHIEAYIQMCLNGKLLTKKGSKISRFTDRTGEIVKYEGTIPPQWLRLDPLPQTPFQFTTLTERFIEDIGGMHDASLGRLPGSDSSGRSIEALQAADAQNVSEPVRNLEVALQTILEKMFDILSKKQIVSKTITLVEGEEVKNVTFVGKSVDKEKVSKGTTIIDKWKVRAQIVPGIAYTEEGKREILFKLVELQVVDPQFVLEQLKTSSIGEILERLQKGKDQDFIKEQMLRETSVTSKDGQSPGQPQDQNAIELADRENMEMAGHREVPATPDEFLTPEHHDLHLLFVQDSKNQDRVNELHSAHIVEEKQRLKINEEALPPEQGPPGMPPQGQPGQGPPGMPPQGQPGQGPPAPPPVR